MSNESDSKCESNGGPDASNLDHSVQASNGGGVLKKQPKTVECWGADKPFANITENNLTAKSIAITVIKTFYSLAGFLFWIKSRVDVTRVQISSLLVIGVLISCEKGAASPPLCSKCVQQWSLTFLVRVGKSL